MSGGNFLGGVSYASAYLAVQSRKGLRVFHIINNCRNIVDEELFLKTEYLYVNRVFLRILIR